MLERTGHASHVFMQEQNVPCGLSYTCSHVPASVVLHLG